MANLRSNAGHNVLLLDMTICCFVGEGTRLVLVL